jgi:hypothetical protein
MKAACARMAAPRGRNHRRRPEIFADVRLTITEQHVDDGIVRLAGFFDATSKVTITGGFQNRQRVHLPIRLAMKVENDRIVKLFESS